MAMPALVLLVALGASAADDTTPPLTGALTGAGLTPIASVQDRARGAMAPWGQLQTWATFWDQDRDPQADPVVYGDPEHDPGFTIARARIGFDGLLPMGQTLAEHVQMDYGLSVGIASPYDGRTEPDEDVQIVDAFARLSAPFGKHPLSVSMGMQRVPFTREALTSSATLLFQERSVSTNYLVPGREVGVVIGQEVRFGESGPSALVRLGAYNGNGALYGDTDPGGLLTARVELSHGETYTSWDPAKKAALGVGFGLLRNDMFATRTTGLGADLIGRLSFVTVSAEFVRQNIEPTDTTIVAPAVSATTGRLGLIGQISFWIPIDGKNGLEVGSRYNSFDDATALDDSGDVWQLHNGVTWRNPLPFVDLGVGFIHRVEPNGELPNDTIRLWTQIRPAARVLK
ncbi:MAG: hypothetical protein ACI8PZ_001542 [Myxococcota bacterium]|jgi:hypothetical protein